MNMLFLEDIISFITYAWWIWIIIIGWWYYQWAKQHVGFSPILTLIIGGLLVWYLVVEHPFIGSLGVIGWVLLTSGVLYFLPVIKEVFVFFGPKREPPKSIYEVK